MTVKIVALADTHGYHNDLTIPDGDVFIHAGDINAYGRETDLGDFNAFLGRLPHRTKLVIAGNHDFNFESDPQGCAKVLSNCTYLQDAGCVAEGIHFYGSPWQPWFHDWAFNLQRGDEIRAKWELIPGGTVIEQIRAFMWVARIYSRSSSRSVPWFTFLDTSTKRTASHRMNIPSLSMQVSLISDSDCPISRLFLPWMQHTIVSGSRQSRVCYQLAIKS
jgi:hypothetical protein